MMDSKFEKMINMLYVDKIMHLAQLHLVITVLATQTTALLLGNVPYFILKFLGPLHLVYIHT